MVVLNPSPRPQADRLALLYQLTQTFNSTLDLDQVLNRVMHEVIVATRAERGFLMLLDETGELEWVTIEDGKEVRFDREPETSGWKRFSTDFLSIIVPESQL